MPIGKVVVVLPICSTGLHAHRVNLCYRYIRTDDDYFRLWSLPALYKGGTYQRYILYP
jgi:hypothetical protein